MHSGDLFQPSARSINPACRKSEITEPQAALFSLTRSLPIFMHTFVHSTYVLELIAKICQMPIFSRVAVSIFRNTFRKLSDSRFLAIESPVSRKKNCAASTRHRFTIHFKKRAFASSSGTVVCEGGWLR